MEHSYAEAGSTVTAGTTDPALQALARRTVLAAFAGHSLPDWAKRMTDEGLGGYLLYGFNIADPGQVATLVGQIRAGRDDVIVALDEEGGDVTRLGHLTGSPYPGNAALGAVDDLALTTRTYTAIGSDLATLGFTLDFAPGADVNSTDDNPIIGTRSFGSRPDRVAAHAAAAVRGLHQAGIAACAKHFPGHGATTVDSHLALPTVDVARDVLTARDLPPFVAAIAAGAEAVMTGHIRIPVLTGDQPATLSRAVLVDLLRDELGFTGAAVTDAMDMSGVSGALGIPAACVRALAAGVDLLCLGPVVAEEVVLATVDAIVAAVRDGSLPAARLEEAAARVVQLATHVPGPASHEPVDGATLGLAAARRALLLEGELSHLPPLIVQIDSPATIAVGAVPWGLAPHLATNGHAETVELSTDADSGSGPEDVVARAHGRQIILVSRDTHRHPRARAAVEHIAASHPAVVMVEMGWPAAWRPAGLAAYVATYGSGPANARAAAELLLQRSA